MDPQIGIAIGSHHFTLFYDYDETRDGKLWSTNTTESNRIEWFHRRVNGVLIEPLSRLLDPTSSAFREVNSELAKTTDTTMTMMGPWRTFTLAGFSVILSAIDALGMFVEPANTVNAAPWTQSGPRFRNFISLLMPEWDKPIWSEPFKSVKDTSDLITKRQNKMVNVLWSDCRCGFAHVLRTHGLGYDIYLSSRWSVVDSVLEINPVLFFSDFQAAVVNMFERLHSNQAALSFFASAFKAVFPPRQ